MLRLVDTALIDNIGSKTKSDKPLFVDYNPSTSNYGDLPISSFNYIGWDGSTKTMESIMEPARIQYQILVNGKNVYYEAVINPDSGYFIVGEVRDPIGGDQIMQDVRRERYLTLGTRPTYIAMYPWKDHETKDKVQSYNSFISEVGISKLLELIDPSWFMLIIFVVLIAYLLIPSLVIASRTIVMTGV